MPFTDYEPEQIEKRCRDPQHNPPSMIVLKPGTYTWECPACGAKQTFTVRGAYLAMREKVGGWWRGMRKMWDEAPGRPESIEEYDARRKRADDAKFRAYVESKRRTNDGQH